MTALKSEQIVDYLKRWGHPHPDLDGTLDEFMHGGEFQAMYDEAVRKNYDLPDVDRWFHLVKVMAVELSFATAMKIDSALEDDNLAVMELNIPERNSFPVGQKEPQHGNVIYHGDFDEVKAQIADDYAKGEEERIGLGSVVAPDLTIGDVFKLYAEARKLADGDLTVFLTPDGVYELSRPEDERLSDAELRGLISKYVVLEPDPFGKVIEDFVSFYSLGLSNEALSDEEMSFLVAAVKDNPGAIINYENIEIFLKEQYALLQNSDMPEKNDTLSIKNQSQGAVKYGKFVFDQEVIVDEAGESINGYLWAMDVLVDRIPSSEDMENINFYADYNLKTGSITLSCSYDTPIADGELNKVMDIPLSEKEKAELIAAFDDYCQRSYFQSCLEFVNQVRTEDELPPLIGAGCVSSLDEQIQAAAASRQEEKEFTESPEILR